MKQEIKEQWVAALRSGEYEQGQRALAKDGKFCCLGVLCELAWKAGGVTVKDSSESSGYVYYDGDSSTLPSTVQEWAGLNDANPAVTVGYERISLAELNDGGERPEDWLGDPYSFAQIADLIDAQL